MIFNIAQLIVLIVTIWLTTSSFILRKKVKKITDDLQKSIDERSKFFDDFIKEHNERLDLLSRENVKLREENEEFKDRLRNLGINDFDLKID
jgi:cell shape-determining protein MreC